jgi:adenine-specific DNA-methyltransferase
VAVKKDSKKQLGAYYTNKNIAEFLVGWAVRNANDKVADPSFGGGVFLGAAASRLEGLGGSSKSIYGVELDGNVHAQTSLELCTTHAFHPRQLLNSDFFLVASKQLPPLDAVVGNPPFIRYQGFSGEARQRALQTVQKKGIHLTKLASSWAAFVIHSSSFLKKGGRLAMVVPAEIGHAKYAKSVLKFLLESFGSITLLSFKESLFPELSQDTLLLLADNKGRDSSHFYLQDLKGAGALKTLNQSSPDKISQKLPKSTNFIDGENFLENSYKLNFYQLPKKARDLYQHLCNDSNFQRLGDVATVGIGYVTGANDFFHISEEAAKHWNIPREFLRPAVYKGSAFKGLKFTAKDWQKANSEDAGFLFYPDEDAEKIEKYLEHGQAQNVHATYKCRTRSLWYKVPHVHQADAFLTYMNGLHSHFVVNEANAVAPNTLHVVRIKENSNLTATDLAVLWQTSLIALSVELEGHALGGGMLKLEPTEAKNILIPTLPKSIPKTLRNKLDKLLRAGKQQEANELADEMVLEKVLGFSKSEIKCLRESAAQLRSRRYYKKPKR